MNVLLYVSISAPSAPDSIAAEASSSTSVTVNWTEPATANGIIRHYNVTYYRTDVGISDAQQVTVTSDTTTELSDLEIFTSYSIFVEAVTVAVGAASNTVTVRTSEDGKSALKQLLPI